MSRRQGRVLVKRLRPTPIAQAVAMIWGRRRIATLETRVLIKNGKPLARAGLMR